MTLAGDQFWSGVSFADCSESIRNAAALTAHGAQELYHGNETGGVVGKWPFPPYYWWESGGAWGSMLQYQIMADDYSYDMVIHDAIDAQIGPAYDFINEAEFSDTGNDDQAFWVFNAMTMAEYNFPQLPSPAPSWVGVVQNAYSEYVSRWNTTYCDGGLKWQFSPENQGFNYKQTISNAAFFQICARLARYTGDSEYLAWAEKIWQWSRAVGLIDDDFNVYDGSDELNNCSGVDHHQWTYNLGVFLHGAASLSNLTGSEPWIGRTKGLLLAASAFFTPFSNATHVLFEAACELQNACNIDQQSMKAYLARSLGQTAILAPYTTPRITQHLLASSIGAASSCTGGVYGNTCGTKWYINAHDGATGLGQQISATEMFAALLAATSGDTKIPGTLPNVTINDLPGGVPVMDLAGVQLSRPLHDQPPRSA